MTVPDLRNRRVNGAVSVKNMTSSKYKTSLCFVVCLKAGKNNVPTQRQSCRKTIHLLSPLLPLVFQLVE